MLNQDFTVSFDISDLQVGDIGPAGGLIFYIDEANEFEWTYLEAARKEAESSSGRWGDTGTLTTTKEGIGYGASNTELIRDSHLNSRAVNYAVNLTDNGFYDWFLPSRDELIEMCLALNQQGLGDFSSHYWSSSVRGTYSIRGRNFATQSNVDIDRRNNHLARAIRSF